MKLINGAEMVSLKEICEEHFLRKDRQTGQIIGESAYFSSMEAMVEGALAFVRFFENLHSQGMVYADCSSDCFFFSRESGAMHFTGSDSVKREEEAVLSPDRAVYSEFMSPEMIEELAACRQTEEEDREPVRFRLATDWYFMSVFLFEYFFHTGSPFEGKRMVNRVFLSPEEKELFRAREGAFCMEPGDHDNGPVTGIQDKLIRYWKEYPDFLKKMFQRAFLSGGIMEQLRPTEVDWKQVLVHMAMDYKNCECGFHGFSFRLLPQENKTLACPKCGKIYYPLSDGLDRILLAPGEKLYACQTGRNPFDKDTVTGLVVENRQHKGLFGIKNVSDGEWRGFFPDHSTKYINKGQVMPIWSGMTLSFERGEDWTLRVIKMNDRSCPDQAEVFAEEERHDGHL